VVLAGEEAAPRFWKLHCLSKAKHECIVCLYYVRTTENKRNVYIYYVQAGSTQALSRIEELLGRKSSGSGLKNRDYGRKG
jgi:hypothetical protein